MTLPVQTTNCDQDTVGGLPAVTCPPPEAVEYDLDLTGQWNPDLGLPPELLPALFLGGLVADVDPEPPLPVSQTLGFSVAFGPLLDPPTIADVPPGDQWQIGPNQGEPSPLIGILIPLAMVPAGLQAGAPLWLRNTITDGNGCVTQTYAYFPEGIPTTATEDAAFYVFADGQDLGLVTILAAANDEDPGPTITVEVDNITPTCPPPRQAVGVAPVCGFEVQVTESVAVELEIPEGGLPVVGTGEGGELTVTGSVEVTTDEPLEVVPAYAPAVVVTGSIDQVNTDPAASGAVDAGWVKLVFKGYGDDGSTVRALVDGIEYRAQRDPDSANVYSPLTIDAPPGLTMSAAVTQVQGTGIGGDAVGISWAAYYPPA